VLWILMGKPSGGAADRLRGMMANLLLVRAGRNRAGGLAIWAALGAVWSRIAAVNSCARASLLGVAGGRLGLGTGLRGVASWVVLAPAGLTRIDNISIDPLVLLSPLRSPCSPRLLFGLIPV